MDILERIFPKVQNLRDFLESLPKCPDVITSKDKAGYKAFLQMTVLGIPSCHLGYSGPLDFLQHSDQMEVVNRVLCRLERQGKCGKNVLLNGFRSWGTGGDFQGPASGMNLPNNNSIQLRTPYWGKLLSRIGDELMMYLLENLSVFIAAPPSCYIQLTGAPISTLIADVTSQKHKSQGKMTLTANSAKEKMRPESARRHQMVGRSDAGKSNATSGSHQGVAMETSHLQASLKRKQSGEEHLDGDGSDAKRHRCKDSTGVNVSVSTCDGLRRVGPDRPIDPRSEEVTKPHRSASHHHHTRDGRGKYAEDDDASEKRKMRRKRKGGFQENQDGGAWDALEHVRGLERAFYILNACYSRMTGRDWPKQSILAGLAASNAGAHRLTQHIFTSPSEGATFYTNAGVAKQGVSSIKGAGWKGMDGNDGGKAGEQKKKKKPPSRTPRRLIKVQRLLKTFLQHHRRVNVTALLNHHCPITIPEGSITSVLGDDGDVYTRAKVKGSEVSSTLQASCIDSAEKGRMVKKSAHLSTLQSESQGVGYVPYVFCRRGRTLARDCQGASVKGDVLAEAKPGGDAVHVVLSQSHAHDDFRAGPRDASPIAMETDDTPSHSQRKKTQGQIEGVELQVRHSASIAHDNLVGKDTHHPHRSPPKLETLSPSCEQQEKMSSGSPQEELESSSIKKDVSTLQESPILLDSSGQSLAADAILSPSPDQQCSVSSRRHWQWSRGEAHQVLGDQQAKGSSLSSSCWSSTSVECRGSFDAAPPLMTKDTEANEEGKIPCSEWQLQHESVKCGRTAKTQGGELTGTLATSLQQGMDSDHQDLSAEVLSKSGSGKDLAVMQTKQPSRYMSSSCLEHGNTVGDTGKPPSSLQPSLSSFEGHRTSHFTPSSVVHRNISVSKTKGKYVHFLDAHTVFKETKQDFGQTSSSGEPQTNRGRSSRESKNSLTVKAGKGKRCKQGTKLAAEREGKRTSLPDQAAQLIKMKTCPWQVYLFLRHVLLTVVPGELWGSTHNRSAFLKGVRQFVSLGRFERLSLHQLVADIKMEDCHWCRLESKAGRQPPFNALVKQRQLVANFFHWLMAEYVLPFIKMCFYVTETSQSRNQLIFYRKSVWFKLEKLGLKEYVANGIMKPISQAEAERMVSSRHTLGFSRLRFISKTKSLRPITKMGQSSLPEKKGRSIRLLLQDLFDVLTYHKTSQPSLLGASLLGTDCIHGRMAAFVHDRKTRGDNRPLYFVKVDIEKCYDSIIHSKLLQIISLLLCRKDKPVEYQVHRYAAVTTTPSGKLQRAYHRHVATELTTGSFHLQLLAMAQRGRVKNAVLINQVSLATLSTQILLQRLRQHVTADVMKIGRRCYWRREGISQGSILSSLLCSFFYAHMERCYLSDVDQDGLLMRLIDDFLLITPHLHKAQRFLHILLTGVKQYGCRANPSKTLVNFDFKFGGAPVPSIKGSESFPWCGLVFNPQTLEVSNDYSKYHNVSIRYTLTMHTDGEAPLQKMRVKLVGSLRAKSVGIFLDPEINSFSTIVSNSYHLLLLLATRYHSFYHCLPGTVRDTTPVHHFFNILMACLRSFHAMAVARLPGNSDEAETTFPLTTNTVTWLGLKAFDSKLTLHKAVYKPLLKLIRKRKGKASIKMGKAMLEVLEETTSPALPQDFLSMKR
ncbi:uncharacterized protein [Diadema antillarum]|uniref:uncharacterized protein n=1 Tax=Diadema antillarum TaxID=105358 RepID=UPI003A86B5D7